MNTNEYYKQCVKDVKNLKGILAKGNLSNDVINALNYELRKQSNNYRSFISGLSEIIDINDDLKPIIENVCIEMMPVVDEVFGCDSKIQEIKILRHLKHDNVGLQEGAFMWHSDRHVNELINVMVYLNDVDKVEHGPFQYIEKDGDVYYNNSIPKNIPHNQAINYGYVKSILGKEGSFFVFDNNFLHRASVPTEKNRDVIIFQVRPTRKKQISFIDMNYINLPFTTQMSNWDRYE
jgi:hypothetical protein